MDNDVKIRTFLGDSPVVFADIFQDDGDTPASPLGVTWDAVDPDGVVVIGSALPGSALTGQPYLLTDEATDPVSHVTFDAYSSISFDGMQWNFVENGQSQLAENEATLVIPPSIILKPGVYRVLSRFLLPNNVTSSILKTIDVVDGLSNPVGNSQYDRAIDHAWVKLEDIFDSDLGGPWLSDKTFRNFDRNKLGMLLPDALYVINNEYQPVTSFSIDDFPPEHLPLLSQALLVEGMYHLIRSYVEQPMPSGGNVSWFDRRDYLSRWQSVLTTEEQKFIRLLDLFKQAFLGFGTTSMLIGGYSSPATRLSKNWRTRYPRWIGPWGV